MSEDTPQNEAPNADKAPDGRTKAARAARAAPLRPRTDGPSEELRRRREERKGRGSVDHSHDQRLTVNGANLDHNNWNYRWVNQEIGRVGALERREWEIVSQEELNGLDAARHVGFARDGKAMNAVLMKKWKPWFQEDQALKLKDSNGQMEEMKRGRSQRQFGLQEGDPEAKNFYAKEKSINEATPTMQTRRGEGYTP